MADFAVTNDFTNGTPADADGVNENFTDIENVFNGNADSYAQIPVLVPIGSIVAWNKTFAEADSGTATSTTSNKLVDSSQNFQTTISEGMIVYNTTDSTYANVTAVDSDTTLSLDADIMVSGETYIIYKTPKLSDGWLECDGSTVSDADSPYNGVAVPDLNGSSGTARFLRGSTDSGTTGGTSSHSHYLLSSTGGSLKDSVTGNTISYDSSSYPGRVGNLTTTENNLPNYYEIVWIMRIK